MPNHDALSPVRVTLRIVHDPDPRVVPEVAFSDGRRSCSWEDFHAVNQARHPGAYAAR